MMTSPVTLSIVTVPVLPSHAVAVMFTLSFAPSDATVVDAEFKAMPNLDEEGTLVNYVEEILTDVSIVTVPVLPSHAVAVMS